MFSYVAGKVETCVEKQTEVLFSNTEGEKQQLNLTPYSYG